MDSNKLLLFMGTECSGIYTLANTFSTMQLPCGFPYASLRNPLAVRYMPPHPILWYWNAVRRIFEELGLPSIAEIPEERISSEERALFIRTIARCLQNSMKGKSFLCGDCLTALLLPFVDAAAVQINAVVLPYLFFSHPAREISALRREQGQPAALTEFIWRNTLTAALRYADASWRILDTDTLNRAGWQQVADEVTQILRPDSPSASLTGIPLQEPLPPLETVHLSPLTLRLYTALQDFTAARISLEELKTVASEVRQAHIDQNGWQYVECLDCGTLHPHAQRLLSQAETTETPAVETCGKLPEDQQGWLLLLEEMEQKLLHARRDYDTALFLHADSLHRHYMHLLEDERQLCAAEIEKAKENARERSKRHSSRVRAAVQRLLQQESN